MCLSSSIILLHVVLGRSAFLFPSGLHFNAVTQCPSLSFLIICPWSCYYIMKSSNLNEKYSNLPVNIAVEKQGNDSDPNPSVTFTIQLQRDTSYYIVILFLPCFSNVMLTLLVFLLPTETGERIGVGINTLFIMWVNYLRVNITSHN